MPTLYSLAKFCHGGPLHHMTIEQIDLGDANKTLGGMDASERIHWAWEKFGTGLLTSTSFGLQSAVMIHLVRQASKEIPIVFIDTGYLFPGTYEYALNLQEKLMFPFMR